MDDRVYGSPGLYAPGGRFNRGDRDRIMPNFGMEQMPQQNLDFLSRLPQNMMPQVDFSNIPQLPENFKFNPQMGQMTPGYAVGGPLMGRAANISRQVLSKNAGKICQERIPGTSDRIFGLYTYLKRQSSSWTTSKFKTRYREFNYGRNWSRSSSFGLDGTQDVKRTFFKR
jgi:hypothetical protein